MEKSLLDYAYDLLKASDEPVLFKNIWEYVVEHAELTEEQKTSLISRFLTNMLLDGRFVNVGDSKWELRERLLFEQVHIDMNEVYSNEEEEDTSDKEENDEGSEEYKDGDEDEEKTESDEFSDEGLNA